MDIRSNRLSEKQKRQNIDDEATPCDRVNNALKSAFRDNRTDIGSKALISRLGFIGAIRNLEERMLKDYCQKRYLRAKPAIHGFGEEQKSEGLTSVYRGVFIDEEGFSDIMKNGFRHEDVSFGKRLCASGWPGGAASYSIKTCNMHPHHIERFSSLEGISRGRSFVFELDEGPFTQMMGRGGIQDIPCQTDKSDILKMRASRDIPPSYIKSVWVYHEKGKIFKKVYERQEKS